MEEKPNRNMKNNVISATEDQNDAAAWQTMEELAGFPAYNDGEGPSATSVSTSRACSIEIIHEVRCWFPTVCAFFLDDELASLTGKTVEIIHCREIKRVDKRMTRH